MEDSVNIQKSSESGGSARMAHAALKSLDTTGRQVGHNFPCSCQKVRIAYENERSGGAMRSMGRVIVLGIAVAVCGGAPVSAATIKTHASKNGGVTITLSGPITFGDSDTFTRELQQATDAGKAVETVQLDSGGGRLVEGVKLATAIKDAGISTSVGPGDVCASACFLIFAAGATKFLGDGARVGVHKASDKDGRETTSSGAATESMAHFAKELGVPASIIARMVRTPSKQIVWLDSQDLKAMGVSLAGCPCKREKLRRADR